MITVAPHILELCSVKAKTAADLTLEETGNLVAWCNCQDASLWHGLSLQEILNVYRVSAEFDTWQAWAEEEPYAASDAWNRAMFNSRNHRIVSKRES